MTMVCGYGCSSLKNCGQFGFFHVKPNCSNSASLLSIAMPSPSSSKGYHSPVCFYDGDQIIKGVNISYCYPQNWSGIGFGYSKNSTFSYSQVFSTYTIGYLCTIFSFKETFYTKCVNYVNNSQNSALFGTITKTSTVT